MIVGVIGSGGREHSICELLKRSNKVNKNNRIECFLKTVNDYGCTFKSSCTIIHRLG